MSFWPSLSILISYKYWSHLLALHLIKILSQICLCSPSKGIEPGIWLRPMIEGSEALYSLFLYMEKGCHALGWPVPYPSSLSSPGQMQSTKIRDISESRDHMASAQTTALRPLLFIIWPFAESSVRWSWRESRTWEMIFSEWNRCWRNETLTWGI